MATVRGITVERAQEIEDASIVGGHISGSQLILTNGAGADINAGTVVPDIHPVDSWPIGSIFMNASATNPSTLLGGGTWARWGQGRMPVSLDSTQAEFDTVEETGGAKSHTLTDDDLPSATSGGVNATLLNNNIKAANRVFHTAVTAVPTLPPYIVVYMWKRTA